jgi:hypothetical protein
MYTYHWRIGTGHQLYVTSVSNLIAASGTSVSLWGGLVEVSVTSERFPRACVDVRHQPHHHWL